MWDGLLCYFTADWASLLLRSASTVPHCTLRWTAISAWSMRTRGTCSVPTASRSSRMGMLSSSTSWGTRYCHRPEGSVWGGLISTEVVGREHAVSWGFAWNKNRKKANFDWRRPFSGCCIHSITHAVCMLSFQTFHRDCTEEKRRCSFGSSTDCCYLAEKKHVLLDWVCFTWWYARSGLCVHLGVNFFICR